MQTMRAVHLFYNIQYLVHYTPVPYYRLYDRELIYKTLFKPFQELKSDDTKLHDFLCVKSYLSQVCPEIKENKIKMNLKTGGRAKSRKVFMKKVRAQAKRDKRKLTKKYS